MGEGSAKASSKALLVVADDFGVNVARSKGIIEAMGQGAVGACSALANGMCTLEMLLEGAQAGILSPSNVGLHVNITEGVPVSPPDAVPSLVDPTTRRFHGKVGLRRQLLRKAIDPAEVKLEITAQLERLRGFFRVAFKTDKVRHADGHHHIHVCPEVAGIFAGVMQSEGVASTRLPLDPCLARDGSTSPSDLLSVVDNEEELTKLLMGPPFYQRVCDEAKAAEGLFADAGLRWATFVGYDVMGVQCCAERVAEYLATLSDHPTVEVMTHVGYTWSPRDNDTEGNDPFFHCFFSRSTDRSHEMAVWCSPGMRQVLEAAGRRVIGFGDLTGTA